MSTTNRPGSDTSWVRRAPFAPIGFFVTWQMIVCLALSICSIFEVLALLALDVLGVVVDVAAVEHRVLRRADVDERRLHARQDVLDLAEVDVPVDLRDVVGRAGHVVLEERTALEHGDLRGLGVDVHAHQVAADGPALALAAPPGLEDVVVEVDAAAGQDRLDRRAGPAAALAAVWPDRPDGRRRTAGRRRRRRRRRRTRRRGHGRRGGACASARRRRRRRRPPAAAPAASAGAGIESPIWGLRTGASSASDAAHERGLGRLDGGRAGPRGAGRAARSRGRVARRRKRRTGSPSRPLARGRAAAACGRARRGSRRRRGFGPGRTSTSSSSAAGGGCRRSGPSRLQGGRWGGRSSGRSLLMTHALRRAGSTGAPRAPPSGRGIGSRRAPSTSVHWWVRSTRPSTQLGIEGADQLRGAEAARLGGQLGDEHRARPEGATPERSRRAASVVGQLEGHDGGAGVEVDRDALPLDHEWAARRRRGRGPGPRPVRPARLSRRPRSPTCSS